MYCISVDIGSNMGSVLTGPLSGLPLTTCGHGIRYVSCSFFIIDILVVKTGGWGKTRFNKTLN